MAVAVIVLVVILVVSLAAFISQTARGNEQHRANLRDGVVTEFEGIRLTDTHLIDGYGPDGTRIPVHGAGALITDHGSVTSRYTATRLATLGIVGFALPKVTDTRSAFVIVAGAKEDGTRWHTTRTIRAQKSRPAALNAAHSFVDLVNSSAEAARSESVNAAIRQETKAKKAARHDQQTKTAEPAPVPKRPTRSLGLRRPQTH